MPSRPQCVAPGVVSALVVAWMAPCAMAQSPKIDFGRDIRPIFEKSCFQCHAGKAQMGGLRLDSRKLAMAAGKGVKVLHPGDPAASTLYQRVAGTSDQARMPMGMKPLSNEQTALIRAWIEQGAPWPDQFSVDADMKKHWAFEPPQRPAPPAVKNITWAANPIDRFILARLEKENLSPSSAAAKATLLRRLSLDLTGLPPTPAEVDAFLRDPSPKAYEKQVDRLLASPHYGERWGRLWLDAARYADSDGYEKDKQRWVWFYRDWVINAFNRDLPYDRFLTEQLAGDLLPNATQEQRVATGFLRNSMINEEGGVDPEQFRMEAMFDRMDAIGKTMLGVTIQCAQCHNHKFDPLTQEEYYRFFAFLNNTHEANIAVYTPDEEKRRQDLFRRVRAIDDQLKQQTPDWRTRMREWETKIRSSQPGWQVVQPAVDDISTGGQRYLAMNDGGMLAAGYAPTKHKVKLTIETKLRGVSAIRLELLNDPNLPLGGPGRSIKGTGALTEFEVEAAPAGAANAKPEKIRIARATADLNLPERELDSIYDDRSRKRRVTGPIEFAIDGKEETAWGIDAGPGRRNQPRHAVFILEKPIDFPQGAVITVYLNQRHGGWNSDDNQNHNLGRFRLALTSSKEAAANPLAYAQNEDDVFARWRATVAEWKDAEARIEAIWKDHPEGSSQLVLAERDDPRQTHILFRGDFLKPGKAVQPGVPSFLNALDTQAPPNRLGLARWLTSRNAPTTARAFVNRVWQTYFGAGIVASSEDLGSQSEPPSHRELLDWLAVEFMDRGWSVKQLHRLIVTSNTYRQSSRVTPELLQRDPFNRLLARAPRLRMEAEAVRDISLAASGLLNPKVGGPSVFAPAPSFLFQPPVSYGPKVWQDARDEDRYRRALYTFRYRSVPYPMLQAFDAPNGDMSCVRRARSNTPLQALTTLNEPLFLEAARALALRALREGGATDGDRLAYAFRRCVSRAPDAAERDELLGLLARQVQRFEKGELSSADFTGLPPELNAALPQGIRPAQLAAWTAVSRVLLNLDETITKE